MNSRPEFIKHWSEIQERSAFGSPAGSEKFARAANFGRYFQLTRIAAHHLTVAPGHRTFVPHAERDEEEFVYVLEGAPDLWADGYLYRLREGEGAGFADRTGIAHSFLNNTNAPVRLLVIGEASRYASRLFHPLDGAANAWLASQDKLWADPPRNRLGPHDGQARANAKVPPKRRKPAYVAHWKDILDRQPGAYPHSTEKHGLDSRFDKIAGLARLGLAHEVLQPGRRTSFPHAERDEEEFVYVVEGEPDVWIDGILYPLREGDGVGFPDRTGIAHAFINNTKAPVRLIVVGEASRKRSKVHYALHPDRNRELKNCHWKDMPVRTLGPHDGLPDALRARQRTAKKKRAKKSRAR